MNEINENHENLTGRDLVLALNAERMRAWEAFLNMPWTSRGRHEAYETWGAATDAYEHALGMLGDAP